MPIQLRSALFDSGLFDMARLLLKSRRTLEGIATDILLSEFFHNARRVFFYKSGRSALSAIFEWLAASHPGKEVLVPDYICNVVPRAVVCAGLQVMSYRTNERFVPEESDLLEKLTRPAVKSLVLASLQGALNTRASVVEVVRRRRPDILLVLDECQNVTLGRRVELDSRTVLVFSFNMKTIRGAMGGGVCFGEDGPGLKAAEAQWGRDLSLEVAVFGVFARQVWAYWKEQTLARWLEYPYAPPHFEYSQAAGRVQYDIVVQRIARFSLVRAIIELRRAAETEELRKRTFAALREFLGRTGAGEIVPTEFPEKAPFVPVFLKDLGLLSKLPWKGPYAVEGDSTRSLRPDLLCFRNDGRFSSRLLSAIGIGAAVKVNQHPEAQTPRSFFLKSGRVAVVGFEHSSYQFPWFASY